MKILTKKEFKATYSKTKQAFLKFTVIKPGDIIEVYTKQLNNNFVYARWFIGYYCSKDDHYLYIRCEGAVTIFVPITGIFIKSIKKIRLVERSKLNG
jgi:hypothetical protein